MLLKDPQKNGGDSKVLDALNIFSEKKIVDNEIIAGRWPSSLEDVVDSLNLYATIYTMKVSAERRIVCKQFTTAVYCRKQRQNRKSR